MIYTFDAVAAGHTGQTIEITAASHAAAADAARALYTEATGEPAERIALAIVAAREEEGPADTVAAVAARLGIDTVPVAAIVKRLFDEAGDDFTRAPYTRVVAPMRVVEGPDGPIADIHLAGWAIEQIRAELGADDAENAGGPESDRA